MSARLPSLSPSGWVEDVSVKADKLMSYFLLAEASQSNWLKHEVNSFVEILKRCHTDRSMLIQTTESALSTLLSRYFDGADVDVTVTQNEGKDLYGWNVNIDAVVVQEGRSYSLGRLVSTVNASIMKIIDLSNQGA